MKGVDLLSSERFRSSLLLNLNATLTEYVESHVGRFKRYSFATHSSSSSIGSNTSSSTSTRSLADPCNA